MIVRDATSNALSSAAAVGGRLRRIVLVHHLRFPKPGRPPFTSDTHAPRAGSGRGTTCRRPLTTIASNAPTAA